MLNHSQYSVLFALSILVACSDPEDTPPASSVSDSGDTADVISGDTANDITGSPETGDALVDTTTSDDTSDVADSALTDIPEDGTDPGFDLLLDVAELNNEDSETVDLGDVNGPGTTCETATFFSPDEVTAVDGEIVWLEGLVGTGIIACTVMLCGEANPCCNNCSTSLGIRTDEAFYSLDWIMHPLLQCRGTNCVEIETCIGPSPGEWIRIGAHVSLPPDESVTFVIHEFCDVVDAPPRRPDAYLAWQAPGGFAGTGPAITVSGNGEVNMWGEIDGFPPAEGPEQVPRTTYVLSETSVDELFGRWAATDTSTLPHATSWAECYPSVWVRLCTDEGTDECAPTEINEDYYRAEALAPEMEAVWQWFDAVLPSSLETPHDNNPRGYCAF